MNNNIYELNIDLFSAVDEEKSKTKICEGWVLITLIKLVSIYWPRLLKQTLKVSDSPRSLTLIVISFITHFALLLLVFVIAVLAYCRL